MASVQSNLLKLALRIDPLTTRDNIFQSLSSYIAPSGATNATPIVISTATPHGINSGDDVYIVGVTGNTAANNTTTNPYWIATRLSSTTFSIADKDGTDVAGNGAFIAGNAIVKGMIGSSDGQKFKRQQILDIYNEARFLLFEALKKRMPEKELVKYVSSNIVLRENINFLSGVGSKPSGYIAPLNMIDYNNREIYIKDPSYEMVIRRGELPAYVETTTNRFLIDSGSTFTNVTGTSVMPDSTVTIKYYLTYFGLTTYILSQVLDGTTTESYTDNYIPMVIELGVAISGGYGSQKALALAEKMVGA